MSDDHVVKKLSIRQVCWHLIYIVISFGSKGSPISSTIKWTLPGHTKGLLFVF